MRLLRTERAQVIELYGNDIPSYAILSHTWSDKEVLLQDLQSPDIHNVPWSNLRVHPPEAFKNKLKAFEKILGSMELACRNGYAYIWIDSCCIDKTSSAELSEAINSMYRWYAGADICYGYLSDVPAKSTEDPSHVKSKFRQSRWFRRGWTLQELVAPQQVTFLAQDWSYLGFKTGDYLFTQLLTDITGIQLDVLLGETSPQDISIAARMHWAAERQTTRIEDIAYCLLGIFDVAMPLLYGEGKRAFIRLQEAILEREDDQSLFAWHSEPVSEFEVTGNSVSSGFSGLLADGPERFLDNNDMETTMPMTLTSSPSAVTSQGLSVDFLLLPCAENLTIKEADFRVVLNCERLRDRQRESPVIYLKRIWGMGDQFARVRPDLKTFIPPNISLLEDGHFERVFVKQDPAAHMRTIRINPAKDSSQLQLPSGIKKRGSAADWKIIDVWPQHGWAADVQTFQTRDMTFGMPCGVLRLEIKESGHTTTIDVAVGMHAPSERSCRSWCQILNLNPFLDPQTAFSWALHEAKSENITYSNLSTQDIHGTDVSNWVIVTEQNRKGRLDITLHVLSDNSNDEAEQKDDLDLSSNGLIIPVTTTFSENMSQDALEEFHRAIRQEDLTNPSMNWNSWLAETQILMGDICIVDSIEISVFPRVSFGSKVRIGSRQGAPPLESLMEYCLESLPASDKETRRLAEVLCGVEKVEDRNYLDASRILEGKSDSFLQLLPVHWAVIGNNLKILQVLLNSGADVVGTTERRLTTLHLAFLLPEPEIFCHIWNVLHATIVEGTRYDVDIFGHFRPTINNGDYPLHFAAAYATSEFWNNMASELLWSGGSNHLGEQAIHRAAAMGNLPALSFLAAQRLGGDDSVNAFDNHDRTPLWHAACNDSTGQPTRRLLSRGANPHLSDINGMAPIHVSCRQGTVNCLSTLFREGANLNHPAGSLGLLPAHFAAVFGHLSCLTYLLKHKAEVVTSGTEVPIYALHLAIANGQEACARAIWRSINPKPIFEGWSLCILLESSGPVLKWMHLEVNEKYWFAIDDPWDSVGTRDFLCSSKDNTPQLWVRPGVEVKGEELESVEYLYGRAT